MEVIYKNKAYKSKGRAERGKRKGSDGVGAGISEQLPDPKFTEVSEEDERRGTASSVSEFEEGCTIDEARVRKRVSEEELHTATLNGIILEYLELMGLEQSYKTFWTECTEKLIPIPLDIRDPLFRRTDFTEADVTGFFIHFDNLNGEGVAELWNKFRDEVDDNEKSTLGQVTILLQIFIASLPFRKNEDEGAKGKALEELKVFNQANSEEFTKHPLSLPLFAFPFVANPTLHPAFKTIFTDEWQADLRKQLESVFGSHLDSHATYGVSTCDLTQMYRHYVETPERPGSGEGNQDGGAGATVVVHKEASPFAKLRPDICAHFKRSLDMTQERYCKLLTVTAAVVGALEHAVQGKEPAIRVLESKLQLTFPEIFDPNVSSKESVVVVHVPKPEVEEVRQVDQQEVQTPEVESQLTVEEIESPEADEAESEEEQSESEFSDQDTEIEFESDGGGDEEEEKVAASKLFTARVDESLQASARSCIALDSPEHDCDRERTMSPCYRNRQGPHAASGLKLTDSKVSTRLFEKDEEWAENEDDEIPEVFCQYFQGLSPSPRKRAESPINNTMKSSLLPPSADDPFPSPPRTYQVAPRNSKLLYIPSSVEVGCCSSGPPTFESRSSSNSCGADRSHGQDDQELCYESPRELRRCLTRGGRLNPDVTLNVAQHLLPIQAIRDTLLLGNRVLTPPPDTKTMSSCPSSPLSSRSPSKEQHYNRKGQNVKGGGKPLGSSVSSDTWKPSTMKMSLRPTASVQVTVPSHRRKSGITKLYGSKKKYSPAEGQGYPGRIYKIDNNGHKGGLGGKEEAIMSSGVLTVKSIGGGVTPD